jgi:glycosyltransferase involved in cell wall biosynthesis
VLFLGQVELRKGIARLLDAAYLLPKKPIEFLMVGPLQFPGIDQAAGDTRFKWIGPVRRPEVTKYYTAADLFILPTLSDGFALTQLEALAYGLPLIVSQFCGDVVRDGVDGIILPSITGPAIAQTLDRMIKAPQLLVSMSIATGLDKRFDFDLLRRNLEMLSVTEHGVSPGKSY